MSDLVTPASVGLALVLLIISLTSALSQPAGLLFPIIALFMSLLVRANPAVFALFPSPLVPLFLIFFTATAMFNIWRRSPYAGLVLSSSALGVAMVFGSPTPLGMLLGLEMLTLAGVASLRVDSNPQGDLPSIIFVSVSSLSGLALFSYLVARGLDSDMSPHILSAALVLKTGCPPTYPWIQEWYDSLSLAQAQSYLLSVGMPTLLAASYTLSTLAPITPHAFVVSLGLAVFLTTSKPATTVSDLLATSSIATTGVVFLASTVVFVKSIKCLSFATALLPLGGCAIALGLIFGAFIRATAYAPDMEDALFGHTMLGFALVETFMAVVLAVIGLIYIY